MKVFIIAAITTDGFIGRDSGHSADWTGSEDKKVFVELTKRAGVMVMGSTTFRTIGRALPGRQTIIYTSRPEEYIDIDDVTTTQLSPAALINELEAKGFNEVAICGGATIYSQFLRAGVVDELYLTVVPKLFGQGIKLLEDTIDIDLELIEIINLGQAALMHYRPRP